MNPYQYPADCDLCGGTGVGTVQTAAAAWLSGSFVSHRDPRVCRDYLDQKERARRAKEEGRIPLIDINEQIRLARDDARRIVREGMKGLVPA